MIIFDLHLGPFSALALRETVQHTFKLTREGPGEVVVDLPYVSITFSNSRRCGALT